MIIPLHITFKATGQSLVMVKVQNMVGVTSIEGNSSKICHQQVTAISFNETKSSCDHLLVAVPQVLEVGEGDVWFGSGDKLHLTLGWVGSHQHH